MSIIVRGNSENLEKFFSRIPAELSKSWRTEQFNMGGQKLYRLYHVGGNSSGIKILEAQRESYDSYYITIGGNPLYALLGDSALSAFASDFRAWANICGVTIKMC